MLSSSSIQTGNTTILSKYGYDDIARLQNSDVLTSDESSGIRHEISYEDFGQDRTTGLVSSIEIKKKFLITGQAQAKSSIILMMI